jgi:Rieske Fe-S protein
LGIALDRDAQDAFVASRPELFSKTSTSVAYPVITAGFVIFSPICPHLGCNVKWHSDARQFICPCHGSKYEFNGKKVFGPAPRGLDPLPLREKDGVAQITWIEYKTSQPDRVIVAYG